MSFLSIILIAIALSMDSFAVSISNGLVIKNLKTTKLLLIALSLAFFQAIMPFFGWLLGNSIEQYITKIDHWIAFGLLSFIGLKMIYESFIPEDENTKSEISFKTVIIQSIATSIDAFAVGISFSLLDFKILIPVLIIGVTTFAFSIIGLQLGKLLGNKIEKSVEILGGVILIAIGIKILIEHLFF